MRGFVCLLVHQSVGTFQRAMLWFSPPWHIASCYKIYDFLPHKAIKQSVNSVRLSFTYYVLWFVTVKSYIFPSLSPLKKMKNSHWIRLQTDEKLKKNAKFPSNIIEKLLLKPHICPLESSQDIWKFPLCPTGHRPFGAAALLSLNFFS